MLLTMQVLFWVSVGVVVYSYAGYAVVLAVLHPFLRKSASRSDETYSPSVSLIMAAFNEEDCIKQKLENCLNLDYPKDKLEILIGSDGSDDRTEEIAAAYEACGVRLFRYHPRKGKMAVINRLVHEARGEILVFSDISEQFDREAIRKLVRHLADPTVGLVAGNHVFNRQQSGLSFGVELYRRFKRFLWRVESRLYSGCRCDGPIYACRKELFPFPPEGTINDDIAVPLGVLAQGARIVFEPEAIVRGDPQPNAAVFFRQKVRCNAGRYQLLREFLGALRPLPVRRSFIVLSHQVLPMCVPWCMLLALISNVALAVVPGGVFAYLLAAQIFFYSLAAAGAVVHKTPRGVPFLSVPFFFVAANIGAIVGFLSFLTKRQQATWQRLD